MTYKEAQQVAYGLIQGYVGPDHRVMDMPSFFGALSRRYRLLIIVAGMTAPRQILWLLSFSRL